MRRIPVRIVYATGLREPLFRGARLWGSWDTEGRYSGAGSTTQMSAAEHTDGCPVFVANIELDAAQAGWTFRWGVSLDGPAGAGGWGIPTEVSAAESQDRVRTFVLSPPTSPASQEEIYYFNRSRWLGAQKHYASPGAPPSIVFRVWAPRAQAVEVCMAALWPQGSDPVIASLVDAARPRAARALQTSPRDAICGGFIADGGDFGMQSGWGPFPLHRGSGGVWESDPLADYSRFDHAPYLFRITRADGSRLYRTDLYSRCQIGYGATAPQGDYRGRIADLDGRLGCSVVVDPDTVARDFREPVFPEEHWVGQVAFFDAKPFPPRPARIQDLVIYEMHLGALGAGRRSADQPGTLEDAIRLLDYLQDLGVNAVELLPLSESGDGGAGWGYGTSHYFAIEYAGGGRDQYKHFIRECHRRGIALILDVVYNHFTGERADRAEWMWDASSHEDNTYLWYEGRAPQYAIDRGGYVDNVSSGYVPRYWEEQVRSMFVSSALALACEFEIDGFRVDQTTSIRDYNRLHADGRALPHVNAFGAKLLRELTTALRLVRPSLFLIAEDHANWDGVAQPVERGGLGFDACWYADFYHHLIGDADGHDDCARLLKNAGFGDGRALGMDRFGAALEATRGGRKVCYHESHDEAGNGQGTDRTIRVAVNGAPLFGATRDIAEARCRFAAGMAMLSAGIPMFLFGEEVGAERPFLYRNNEMLANRFDLLAERKGNGARLFEFYRHLIRFRLERPALRSPDIEVVYTHDDNRVIAFRRFAGPEELLVVGTLNNRAFDAPHYELRSERVQDGDWREIWNSDSHLFGGADVGNAGGTLRSSNRSLACVLPRVGFIVLERLP